jgi:dTDP-4-amino-4,6-dideoxygalactose transaminase
MGVLMKVPFLDLKAQINPIRAEIQQAINEVIDQTAFAGGPFVEKFEKEFAAFCGSKHCVAVGNGTDAIWLALLSLGIAETDEVITAPSTFVATAEAISFAGAEPVFVDIEPDTCNMDPGKIEKAITSRTKAIIPVHLFGQPADMDPILEIARRHNLVVIEDSCQAHGALYKGKKAGTMGVAGCFSFYPGKNLGAFGEAGAVVTDDGELARKIRIYRDHGQPQKYHHDVIGWNARMDGIQGAVLSVKLKCLDRWTEARRDNAKQYDKLLLGVDSIRLPVERDYAKHVYHIYALRDPKRDALITFLNEKGVATGIHYPVPVHMTKAYAYLERKTGSYPVAELAASEFISLPMYPELTSEQITYVCDCIKEFHSR